MDLFQEKSWAEPIGTRALRVVVATALKGLVWTIDATAYYVIGRSVAQWLGL